MKLNLNTLLEVATKYEKLSLAQSQTSQSGDFYKAIVDSKVLGLKGNGDPSSTEFDVNSPAADKIFGIMDSLNFKGEVVINVLVDPAKNVTLKINSNPPAPKVTSTIQKTFQSAVAMAVKHVSPPGQAIELPNVVTAKNA